MNEALRFDRGYLRARVLPAIRERWPAAAATVARSAAASRRSLAPARRARGRRRGGLVDDGRVSLAGLERLPRDRQVNVLRWWLRAEGLRPPAAAQLGAVLPDFFSARPDGAPCLAWPEGEIRRYRGRLYAGRPLPARPRAVARGEAATFDLGPGLGCLQLVEAVEGGLRTPLPAAPELRFRVGGESLKPHPGRPRKRLKDLCQEAGVVPWMRDRLPLVYVGERLAAVGDLWIDAEFAAPPGQPALKPVWEARPRIF